MKRFLLALALVLAMAGWGWGATRYVSNSTANGWPASGDAHTPGFANDSNTAAEAATVDGGGNPTMPWLTVTKAAADSSNGDTVIVNDGTYTEAGITITPTTLTINPVSSLGAHIIMSSGSQVIRMAASASTLTLGALWLDANNVAASSGVVTRTGVNNNLTLNGTKITGYLSSGVRGNGLKEIIAATNPIISSDGPSNCYGILVTPNADSGSLAVTGGSVTLTSLTGGSNSLIKFAPAVAQTNSSFTYDGTILTATGLSGTPSIYGLNASGSPTVNITNPKITLHPNDSTANHYGISISIGTVVAGVTLDIHGDSSNYININHNNTAGGWSTYGVVIKNGTGSGVVYGLNIYNAANAFETVNASTALSFYNNYSERCCNHYWLTYTTNSYVYYNIAKDFLASGDADVGYIDGENCSGNHYWNNVIVNTVALSAPDVMSAFYSEHGAANTEFLNNIASGLFDHFVVVDATSSATLDYDTYYATSGAPDFQYGASTYATFDLWKGAGYDTHGYNANPILISGYHIPRSSPAYKTGTPVVGPTVDYYGKAIGNPPNIGASEGFMGASGLSPGLGLSPGGNRPPWVGR